jgi:hypothetical protein
LSAGAAEAEVVVPSPSGFDSGFGSGCNTSSGLDTVPSLDQVVETDMGGRFVYKNQHLFRSECHDMPVNASGRYLELTASQCNCWETVLPSLEA